MIKSFRHTGLRELWETGKSATIPNEHVIKIIHILEVIDSAVHVPQDIDLMRSWRLHPLKGGMKGYWSIVVKKNWRIIFRFENKNAFDLGYLDYH